MAFPEGGSAKIFRQGAGGPMGGLGPREGRTGVWHIGQILVPLLSSPAWICTSNFVGTDLSSPIVVAVALLGVRGLMSPYSKFCCCCLHPCIGYNAEQLVCLFLCRTGLGHSYFLNHNVKPQLYESKYTLQYWLRHDSVSFTDSEVCGSCS